MTVILKMEVHLLTKYKISHENIEIRNFENYILRGTKYVGWFTVFNATFNNISAISLR
jgi:hypothetical protein